MRKVLLILICFAVYIESLSAAEKQKEQSIGLELSGYKYCELDDTDKELIKRIYFFEPKNKTIEY
jgi:hypothetical protein